MIRKLALVLAVAVPLSAQVTETIEVAITNVDVVVTDANGRRVRGLTKDDFEVVVDGKPREITNFAEYALTEPATGAAKATINATAAEAAASEAQAAPPPPRRVLLVFDSNTLTSKHRRNAAADALKFIDAHVRPGDRVMVGVLTQMFTPRTDWTTDRTELRRAIDAIGSEVSNTGMDAERKRAEDEMMYLIDIAAGTVGTDPRVVVPPTFEELVAIARRYAEQALVETRSSAAILGTVVSQFSTYPEKKAMVVLGEGFDAKPGWELFEKLQYLATMAGTNVGIQIMLKERPLAATALVNEANRFSAVTYLNDFADSAYRKGVPIYLINPGVNEEPDIGSTDLTNPSQKFARHVSKSDGYQVVGNGSGGAAFIGMRAELALNEVAGDLGSYYSLGFRAPGTVSRAQIRVKTRQGNHQVRTALAGALPGATDSVSDAVVAHHVLEPSTNDLEIALEAAEPVAAGEKQRVTLSVIIPIRNLALVRQGEEVTGGFDIYLSISDGKGYFSEVNKQSHTIKWRAADVPENDERTMTYSIDVTMEHGASQISVGVVDQRSKKTGYERIEVQG